MTDPLSTDCPARQMARDFIAKFNRDDGRGKSLEKAIIAKDVTSKTRRAARAKVDSFLATPPPWTRMDVQIADIVAQCDREYGFGDSLNRTGILGRFGNGYVREDPQRCAVGDAVPLDRIRDVPHQNNELKLWKQPVPFFASLDENLTEFEVAEILTFTKIGCEMTSDNGRTFQTCWFWKRVS